MGGVHGANRLAGNALMEIQVFGALAGQEALAYLRKSGPGKGGEKSSDLAGRPPRKGESWVWDAICEARARNAGFPIGELQVKIRDLMQQYGAVIRTASGLEEAMRQVHELEDGFLHRLALPNRPEKWHPDWLAAAETINMLQVSRTLLAGAQTRAESRGAHFRDDHPDLDPKWNGHNLIVRGAGEKVVVFRRDRSSNQERQVWP